MESNRSRSAFELVPESWFEPVVGLWVVLLAVLGVRLAFAGADQLLGPLAGTPWAVPVLTVLVAAFTYGVFCFGVTHAYRSVRNFEPRIALEPLDRREWRWVGGLGVAALLIMGLSGAWSVLVGRGFDAAIPLIGVGSPFSVGKFPFELGLVGVNHMVNQAPFVAFAALLGGLFVGPATGALFHGVLQDTLARVSSPLVAIASTAAVTTVLLKSSVFVSTASFYEAASAVVVFGFVLGAGYAYRETENLLVVMAAYGLFDGLAVVIGWLNVLAKLYAGGNLLS